MRKHLSEEIVERFQLRGLSRQDRRIIYDHMLACEPCSRRIADSRREAAGLLALCAHFLPGSEDEPYHLNFELIEAYVSQKLTNTDNATAEMHLEVCEACLVEANDLRASLATVQAAASPKVSEVDSTKISGEVPGLRRVLFFGRPIRSAAIAACIVLACLIAVVIRQQRGSEGSPQEMTKQSSPSPAPTPLQSPRQPIVANANNGSVPKTNSTATEALRNKTPRNSSRAVTADLIVLNDGSYRITIDRSGDVEGLSGISTHTREAVREAVVNGSLKRPDLLNELSGRDAVLRGSAMDNETVRLVSPENRVLLEDRPVFRWTSLKDATGYRVVVGDEHFRQAAQSGDLPGTATQWQPSAPLKRGMVYTWMVMGIRSGEALGSHPSSAASKFKVLEEAKVKELDQLKSSSPSHLALGVFYAGEGMITNAEREFQLLAQQNPDSAIARNLLKQIRTWIKVQ